MSSLSLRSRLLAGLGTVAIVLVAAAWAITVTTRDHLVAQVDDRLAAASDPGREGRFDDRATVPPPPPETAGDGDRPDRLSDVFEGFIRPGAEVEVFFEPNLPGQEYSPPDISWDDVASSSGEPFTAQAIDGDVRYRVLAIPGDGGAFVQAVPLASVDDTVEQLILFEVLGVTAVLLVLAAVTWWVIHLGIRPIKAMTETAAEINEGDLSVRLPEPAAKGTEAGALARTLNSMFGRIETAVDRQTRSDERLRRFVADASHELRTPITTIRGYAELYRQGGLDDPAELDDAMGRTEQEADRMGRLVEDMLTLAKLDQERPLDRAPVDLAVVVSEIVADARVSAPDHDFDATVESDLVVAGDEDRLRQVLGNVVGNAVAHTPTGTAISVEARHDGETVVVEVNDDGPGMEPEAAARATERFYRVDMARARADGGSGLGLSIADAVAAAHEGRLDITSETGGGTSVTLTLPTATDDAPPDSPPSH